MPRRRSFEGLSRKERQWPAYDSEDAQLSKYSHESGALQLLNTMLVVAGISEKVLEKRVRA